MTPDLINGGFELAGALMNCLSIRALLRDRQVLGVSPWPSVFFLSWGLWNLIYYPSLAQFWSTIGGGILALTTATWLGLYLRFSWWDWKEFDDDTWGALLHEPCPVCRRGWKE